VKIPSVHAFRAANIALVLTVRIHDLEALGTASSAMLFPRVLLLAGAAVHAAPNTRRQPPPETVPLDVQLMSLSIE
jgi:hypothetical protein